MNVNEIYLAIAQQICNIIEDENWETAVLNIKRQDKSVGFSGFYLDIIKSKKFLDIWSIELEDDIIHELHAITTEGGHNRWNKLEFTLFPDGKFDLQFIWDQEWQDEVDGYNKKS